jgi:glutamine synthetase adenylyltransferase
VSEGRFKKRLAFGKMGAYGLVLMCLVVSSISAAEEAACPRDVVAEANRARRLNYRETLERATRQVPPELPAGLGMIRGTIVVDIIIDETGKVVCAKARPKHNSYLAEFCVDAAKQWTFHPVVVKGQPVKVWGRLEFHLER